MRRKIISLAKSTYVVTIPFSWCDKNSLKKGDSVDVTENEDSLVISPIEKLKKADIDISWMDPMIKRVLGAYYKSGYDEMRITYSTEKEKDIAEEVIREEFIGFEILSHNSERKTIVAKSVAEPTFNDFDNMLRRMVLLIASMGEEIRDNMNDKEMLKKTALLDKDVNKISDYCRRAVNRNAFFKISKDFKKNTALYFIVEQLEKIGDEFRDYANSKDPMSGMEAFREVCEYYGQFYDLFYKFKVEKVKSFGDERYRLRKKFDEIIAKSPSEEIVICRNIVEKTFDMSGPLMVLFI